VTRFTSTPISLQDDRGETGIRNQMKGKEKTRETGESTVTIPDTSKLT
jgi:hypothetical protein